tara:strand:- start:86 stop:214 length:129 start_codon:yes stop_codon:yes gene_type:complete
MKILKNMHPTDKEALAGIVFLLGTITLFVTALWGYAILSGQA